MANEVRVDSIRKVSEKAICAQYDDLDNPTILPFSHGHELVNLEDCIVWMTSGMVKSTAKALGLSTEEYLAEYEV